MITSITKTFEIETPVICSKCKTELKATFSEKEQMLLVEPHICKQEQTQ